MKTRELLILLALSVFLPLAAGAARLPDTLVRIALEENQDRVNVSCDGDFYYCDLGSGDKYTLGSRGIYTVKPTKIGIMVDGKEIAAKEIRFTPENPDGYIRVEGRRYRDSISIRKTKRNKLIIINELGLEGYLAGILTREVDHQWPMEALKAQAVASRTFAVCNLDRHTGEGFSLCNKVHCQVFGGVESEHPRTNKAIVETRGQVLVYKKRLINAVFHSCCAGYTEDARSVWGADCKTVEYLSSVRCRFCKDSSQYSWNRNVQESYIRKKLQSQGYGGIARITGISFKNKTKSGRSKTLTIKYRNNKNKSVEISMSSARFRLLVDPWTVKSTKFSSIKPIDSDNFKFVGNGWGHGVGMCQWGAKGMADKGYSYKEILGLYYSGAKIEKWDE